MPRTSTNPTSSTIDPDPHHPDSPRSRLPDLRRREVRRQAEIIVRRASFLPCEQRALITAVYQRGESLSDLAAMCGKSTRQIRREIRRILARLASPEFTFVALHRAKWGGAMRSVAETCVLAGQPVRRAARTLHLSLHTVRKHREMVRLLAAGAARESDLDLRSKAG